MALRSPFRRDKHGFTILPVDKDNPLGEGRFTHAVYLNGVYQAKFTSEKSAKNWIKAMADV